MDKVVALLEGYAFDVVLGSVHWLGAWGFDNYEDPIMRVEWDARSVDDVWDRYATALEELAASGVCDVVAHPDLAAARDEMGRLQDLLSELEEAVTRVRMAARTSLSVLERAFEAASTASAATEPAEHASKGEDHPPQPAGEGKGWPKPPGPHRD